MHKGPWGVHGIIDAIFFAMCRSRGEYRGGRRWCAVNSGEGGMSPR